MVVLVLIVGLTLCIALMKSARHRKYRCIDLCSHRIMVSVKFSLATRRLRTLYPVARG